MEAALTAALLIVIYAAYAILFVILLRFVSRKLSLRQSTQLFCAAAAALVVLIFLVISAYRTKGFHIEMVHVLLVLAIANLIVQAYESRKREKAADEHR